MPPDATLTDTVADAHILERDRTHLTDHEQTLLKELLRPGASIEAVIPDDVTAAELWKTLEACAGGLAVMEARTRRLKPIIGRILVEFQNVPSRYKDLGYETWSDFMRVGVYEKLGVHHQSAYECLMLARDWKQVTPDRFAKIGTKKMNTLNKFTKGNSPNAEEWLKRAESMKATELQQYVEQRGFLEPGEAAGATFTIHTNQAKYVKFKEFFDDGRVHSVVGSRKFDDILEKLIWECHSEWIDKAEQEQARKRAGGKKNETATTTDISPSSNQEGQNRTRG
jgi:hypothetical protein